MVPVASFAHGLGPNSGDFLLEPGLLPGDVVELAVQGRDVNPLRPSGRRWPPRPCGRQGNAPRPHRVARFAICGTGRSVIATLSLGGASRARAPPRPRGATFHP